MAESSNDQAAAAASSHRSPGAGTSRGGRKRTAAAGAEVAGVRLTHPDRVLYPEQGLSKLALAQYYAEIAEWILPRLERRPLSLLRCPAGRCQSCFFQKHPGQSLPAELPRVAVREKSGRKQYVFVEETAHLVALVQLGTLELHTWGCRVEDLERPDMLVLDLDPGPGVEWPVVVEAARALRDRIAALKLDAFLRTTGGKGLHVVVPLEPRAGWDEVKAFARALAAAHAADDPRRFTINMSKAERRGRIFIDYLRNGRTATAIASYSTRARPGAPVAVPVRRDEPGPALKSDRCDVDAVRRRLKALSADPWEAFEQSRRPLTPQMLTAAGADKGR